ncbi:MAG: GTPase [Candidatus Poseidoniales archaeon]|jgi:ribosome-binding ATPase YchF (GTP1/OBG family)
MRIGLVGKPNVGKSTFFSAATQSKVDIANYPFCTINPNVGVAFLPAPMTCPCAELRQIKEEEGRLEPVSDNDPRAGSLCEPRTGSCIAHKRLVPVFLVDVAGLVPGAHAGKGRGNAFLSDLARCDALIQVVDAAGTTDIEGNPIGVSESEEDCIASIKQERDFLVEEITAWIHGIIEDGWIRGARRVQAEGEKGLVSHLHERLSGLGANTTQIKIALESFTSAEPEAGPPWDWGIGFKKVLASHLRKIIFPIHIAANKAEIAPGETWKELQEEMTNQGSILMPTMADAELGLRRAGTMGFIEYDAGDTDFEITELGKQRLKAPQVTALEAMKDTMKSFGGTGVATLISRVLYESLGHIVAYPVQDETHWCDGEGKILPDALVIPGDSTSKQLAYSVHTDLGNGFIKAIDGKSKRVIGADHELSDGDVIKIHSKS